MTELQVSEDRHPLEDESEEELNTDSDPDDTESRAEDNADVSSEDVDSDMKIPTSKPPVIGVQSRFAALNIGGNDDGSEDSQGESSG